MNHARASALLLVSIGLLVGCAHIDNDRLTLGPGRGGPEDVTLTSVEPGAPMSPATSPSVTGVDRSSWATVEVVSPQDRAQSNCSFTDSTGRDNARHMGRYPSAVDALDLSWNFTLFGCAPRSWERAPRAQSMDLEPQTTPVARASAQ